MVRYLVMFDIPDDADAFDEHYRTVHVPLAQAMPGIRRFTVSTSPKRVRGAPFYLVAALDWDDMDALQQAFSSPAGQATARDVDNLAAPGRVHSTIFELEDLETVARP